MKRVTIADIASRVGISKYSVSRALSGKPGVSEATRRSVYEAAREMGYRHSSVQREQDDIRPRFVVLLIPHQDVEDAEFWMGLIHGASSEAEARGYTFVTRPLGTSGEHNPSMLDQVAGVIVGGSRARYAMEPYIAAGIPASLATYPQPLEPRDAVHAADWEGGMTVARHLMRLGHTRLAFVTGAPDKPSFSARGEGFAEAVAADSVADAVDIVIDSDEPGLSFEKAYRQKVARGGGPTGILASTDGLAFSVAGALGRIGLNIPADVSLVGFNDSVASGRFVPKLTTLRIPTYELGVAAMRFLHDRIGNASGPPRRLELAPELILRESTAAPRADAVRFRKQEAIK